MHVLGKGFKGKKRERVAPENVSNFPNFTSFTIQDLGGGGYISFMTLWLLACTLDSFAQFSNLNFFSSLLDFEFDGSFEGLYGLGLT